MKSFAYVIAVAVTASAAWSLYSMNSGHLKKPNSIELQRADEADTVEDKRRGFYQCKSKKTGSLLPGIGPRINCKTLTACQREWEGGDEKKNRRGCDYDGRYLSKRCDDDEDVNSCFCIDLKNGEKLSSSPANYYQLKCTVDCDGGMVYQSCGGCELTCRNRNTSFACDQMCRSKCACPHGLFWSDKSKKCVIEDEC